jgi:hypothetical protein
MLQNRGFAKAGRTKDVQAFEKLLDQIPWNAEMVKPAGGHGGPGAQAMPSRITGDLYIHNDGTANMVANWGDGLSYTVPGGH